VRWIGWILLALFATGWWACQIKVDSLAVASAERSDWRRTASGWERRDDWHLEPAPRQPLHPMAIASLQLVAALGLLVQHDERDTRRSAVRD
jgi:hypothetical protein